MRILYVVSRPLEINTSSSIRNRATIEGLLQLGHDVEVITTQFDKNHSSFDENLVNNRLKIQYIELGGIQDLAKYGRKYKIFKPLKNMVYHLMSNFEIYDNLKGISSFALKTNIQDGDYDIIISSSDPKSSHLFVSKMFESGKIKDTPWIQIWGDPFLSDITRKNKLLNSKIKHEENRLLKDANKVVYVSKLTMKEQQKLYPHYARKMSYEPIPYVKKEIYPITKKHNQSLTFLYCGDYSSNVRDIKPLYEAIKKTEHSLIICGNTDIKLENTDHIKIYQRVSFEKTKEFERECDILVHLSNLRGTQIPGKIYQYSGTNKLILFILDGQTQVIEDTFRKYNRYVFSNNDKKDIENTIDEINKGIYENFKFVVEEFSPQAIANKILE